MDNSTHARFWAKVEKTAECWNWTGHRKPDGYGRFRLYGARGKQHYVHRLAYELANGPIPEGMQVDHICHNTSCVRPGHLRLATPKQNQEHRVAANSGNASGVRGVTRDGNRWVARVRHNGRTHYAGSFGTVEEATDAVRTLRLELFTHNTADRVA